MLEEQKRGIRSNSDAGRRMLSNARHHSYSIYRIDLHAATRSDLDRSPALMLVAFNKPYGVLCQFTDRSARPRRTLAEYGLPGDVYPAGRLDFDSEGLLLLTDDGGLAHRLTDPRHKQPKTYWVQVEGDPDECRLDALRRGVLLNDGPTLPAQARRIDAPTLWPRVPPVRFRKTVPDAWLELTIREGRNRQVRRMTAAVGLPTLRLVRVGLGEFALDGLAPGEWRLISPR